MELRVSGSESLLFLDCSWGVGEGESVEGGVVIDEHGQVSVVELLLRHCELGGFPHHVTDELVDAAGGRREMGIHGIPQAAMCSTS